MALKGWYIDSALQMVLGGDENSESAVWREDVEALLPMAVNYALNAGMWEQLKLEKDFDLPGSFIGTFENLPVDITDPDEPFFTIPGTNLITLTSDRALRMVYTKKGFNVYQRMSDNLFSNWGYYKKLMVDQRFFRVAGMACTLFNKPDIEDTVCCKKIVSTEDYGDLDEMPIPAGQELVVVQQLVKLFDKQRRTPEDPYEDGSDINE